MNQVTESLYWLPNSLKENSGIFFFFLKKGSALSTEI